jgi:hypothetical protein
MNMTNKLILLGLLLFYLCIFSQTIYPPNAQAYTASDNYDYPGRFTNLHKLEIFASPDREGVSLVPGSAAPYRLNSTRFVYGIFHLRQMTLPGLYLHALPRQAK